MEERLVYHVVTDKPVQLGQHIVFDEFQHNGVWNRVHAKMDIVNDIVRNPDQYNQHTLEHHTSVALRELALEEVRQKRYPEYPSRMGCLYVSETLDEAEKWGDLFTKLGRPTYSIVKLRVRGNCFYGDANHCFDARPEKEENLLLAEHYWANHSNADHETPIIEILVNGDIKVIEIVKVINANL